MKTCSKKGCGEIKPIEEFYKTGNMCKVCTSIHNKQYKETHKEENKETQKIYNQKNREKRDNYDKEYKETHKEERKEYNETHKEKILIDRKIYQERANELNRNRYHSDPLCKLKSNIRTRIHHALKNGNKLHHSIEYLGCTAKEYKSYLESKFTPQMNWQNHGFYWEIDHKKQLWEFDLTIEKNQFKAFNYKNTRPLEKSKNRSRPKR